MEILWYKGENQVLPKRHTAPDVTNSKLIHTSDSVCFAVKERILP